MRAEAESSPLHMVDELRYDIPGTKISSCGSMQAGKGVVELDPVKMKGGLASRAS